MSRIYAASSWRNVRQPLVVQILRDLGHEVFDFRHPEPGNNGFHWSDIDPGWETWSPSHFLQALRHPLVRLGLKQNTDGMESCDTCILVMPCGRSAHLELGWFIGKGKKSYILLDDGEPELMYGMVDGLFVSIEEMRSVFRPRGE